MAHKSFDAAAIGRLEQVVREEIAALSKHEYGQIAAFTDRKARCLLELARVRKSIGPDNLDLSAQVRLQHLRRDLEADKTLLAAHIRAAGDVAALLSRELSREQSDGTYTAAPSRVGSLR